MLAEGFEPHTQFFSETFLSKPRCHHDTLQSGMQIRM